MSDRPVWSLTSDYLAFIIFIAITTVYPLWRDGRKKDKSKEAYVFASGSVSMLPMMFSIARGVMSVRALLGKI